MHVFRDSHAIKTAAQRIPALASRLTWLVSEVSSDTEKQLDEILTIVVVEEGDDIDHLVTALDFEVREEGVENITQLPGWFELTFIVNGEGFGYIVYVPSTAEISPNLLAFCRAQLPQETGASSPHAK